VRIAQVAPLYESVPPQQYGGTERVVSALTDELVAMGHEVTLFASGDSDTKASLRAPVQRSLRKRMNREEMLEIAPPIHLKMLAEVSAVSNEFDVIHSHVDHLAFSYARLWSAPSVHTLHGRLDTRFFESIHRLYRGTNLISISNDQRLPLAHLDLSWRATVYNGLDLGRLQLHEEHQGYLAFLGRINHEKRPDRAVEIAHRAGLPLRVAAKVDPVDVDYWNEQIKPLFLKYDVDFIGEIGDGEKSEFLGGAAATLFPIDWPEPFGLVMVESMACGTPVVAARRGSVPEVIDEGVGGFIGDSLDEMVEGVEAALEMDRKLCAKQAQRFSAQAMAEGYLEVYHSLIGDERRYKGVGASRDLAKIAS
jgi:glycosyltransferase involved in cell wall biosynthesis